MNQPSNEPLANLPATRHPYATPELIALELSATSKLNWVSELAAPTVLQAS